LSSVVTLTLYELDWVIANPNPLSTVTEVNPVKFSWWVTRWPEPTTIFGINEVLDAAIKAMIAMIATMAATAIMAIVKALNGDFCGLRTFGLGAGGTPMGAPHL